MKRAHLARRTPRKCYGFSWGRVPLGEAGAATISYRLFLRDSTGRCFMEQRTFSVDTPRVHIAKVARGMRVQLRWAVDQIEFARLGMQDTTPRPLQAAA